jgi:NAD(P)-dependent dehydrogenase (short-subunit alcohol dehydrogenase family)
MSQQELNPAPVYLIFGATGGIGASLCRRLAASGATVAISARNAERLQTLAEDLHATAYPLDATGFDAVDRCVQTVLQAYGRIDGVANCIGSLILKPAHSTSEAEWDSTVTVNLTSAFAILRASARAMMSLGGSIVLVSSAAGRIGIANHEAIAAVKAGVIGLTLSAAATYAPRRIRVNCVAPGLVRTPMTSRLTSNEASLKTSTAMHAMGRLGEPDDVSSAIEWLLSPQQSWVTGQTLGIDGGLGSVLAR